MESAALEPGEPGPELDAPGTTAAEAQLNNTPPALDEAGLDQWQTRLLPFMTKIIALVTAFFLLASLVQVVLLQIWIGRSPELAPTSLPSVLSEETLKSSEQVLAAGRFEALAKLELLTVGLRYHQANALLMSRVWVRYLGFVTGMILSLIGATFILGKLREPPVDISSTVAAAQFSFVGASPGIFLVLAGLVLMLTTVAIHRGIEVTDAYVYVDDYSHYVVELLGLADSAEESSEENETQPTSSSSDVATSTDDWRAKIGAPATPDQ
jgi:hypothetical protein